MDMGYTQPPIPWVQGINGTRFENGLSPHITSRLGRLRAIPLLTFYVFMRFIWTTVIIFIERHVAFNYAVNCQIVSSSSSSSSSSDLQTWVGLGLLKQMSSATSILGNRQPISTIQLLCVFLYPLRLYNASKHSIGRIILKGC